MVKNTLKILQCLLVKHNLQNEFNISVIHFKSSYARVYLWLGLIGLGTATNGRNQIWGWKVGCAIVNRFPSVH